MHACVCVCTVFKCWASTYIYINFICSINYAYTVCTYVIVFSKRYCNRPPDVSSIYSRTTYIHTYICTYIRVILSSSVQAYIMGHSCYLRHWQQSPTSPLSTRTCWQTTDTTPSMCGRTALSTWPRSVVVWVVLVCTCIDVYVRTW